MDAPVTPVAAAKAPRDFTYIKPRKRRVSEYEAVTCYTQPDPEAFDKEGWYLRTPEGRTAWMRDSTKLVHHHWFDFRDPASHWQRTYVRMQDEQEGSIARICEDAAADGSLQRMDPSWTRDIVAGHYRVWSFFEYGLFRAFAVQQREALSDTIGNCFAFESVDRTRAAQAAVIYLMDLEDSVEGFKDQGAKERWMQDPLYQPLRSVVEHLMALQDWAELAVATNLVIDPIVTQVGLSILVRRFGSYHGDEVTPYIVSTSDRDRRRNLAWTEELVRMVTDDNVVTAEANRGFIQGWIDKWTPIALDVAQSLAPVYDLPPIQVTTFKDALEEAVTQQRGIVEGLGFNAAPELSR